MLTFKSAPKTLLGPCEHALWNGTVFLSRHHLHMPQGPDGWEMGIRAMLSEDPEAVAVVEGIVAGHLGMAAAKWNGEAYAEYFQMWDDASQILLAKTRFRGL